MSTKSTTLYLGDNRLSIRLPIELWRDLAKYSRTTKEKGNTLMTNLLIEHFKTSDLAAIHEKLLSSRYDPSSGDSGNTIVVNLLTQYFNNPV